MGEAGKQDFKKHPNQANKIMQVFLSVTREISMAKTQSKTESKEVRLLAAQVTMRLLRCQTSAQCRFLQREMAA